VPFPVLDILDTPMNKQTKIFYPWAFILGEVGSKNSK
jgi:hypothetical protein